MSIVTERPIFRVLPLASIYEPELPSRSAMDDVKLDELSADIRLRGLLAPMIVATVGEQYRVVAGHRRRIACERAGLVEAPCLVYSSMTTALEGVKYAENRFREELSVADEAIWFAELLDRDCGGDVDKLCAQLNEKRSYIEGRLLLLGGDPKVFEALQAHKITIGVAQQLNRVTEELIRRSYLHNAIIGGATVAVVSGWVMEWRKIADVTPPGAAPLPSDDGPAPVPETDVFKCVCCEKSNHPHTIVYLPIHSHCKLALLDPLLDTLTGKA